jgi:hypothetical protein
MRILILASVLGILASIAVLMVVIVKANREKEKSTRRGDPPPLED